jgi:cbb3-type cytochrome oxidase cytochrome c subunit
MEVRETGQGVEMLKHAKQDRRRLCVTNTCQACESQMVGSYALPKNKLTNFVPR